MKFFIDEGGHFTPNVGISVICSLALPHCSEDAARLELTELSREWPHRDGELKGGLLNGEHLAALVGVLYRRNALLHCHAIDMSAESQDEITQHKIGQCEGITKYLLPTHPPELVRQVQQLRSTLEKMPNQLYVQCVMQSELVMAAAEHAAMYFAQRRPEELGTFEWIIDAKDPKRISTQEKWWRETLGPLGESKSRQRPFGRAPFPSFDYSHFDQRYTFEKELWWPDRPRELVRGIDIKKLITETLTFRDSRSDILIQAADILANFMRRALGGETTQDSIIRSLGKLQIIRKRDGVLQSIEMLSFSKTANPRNDIGRLSRKMTKAARPMLLHPLPRERN